MFREDMTTIKITTRLSELFLMFCASIMRFIHIVLESRKIIRTDNIENLLRNRLLSLKYINKMGQAKKITHLNCM